jgi:hypothetical protein
MDVLGPWTNTTVPVVYAMGLQKTGTTLLAAALAATLRTGHNLEARYFCHKHGSTGIDGRSNFYNSSSMPVKGSIADYFRTCRD